MSAQSVELSSGDTAFHHHHAWPHITSSLVTELSGMAPVRRQIFLGPPTISSTNLKDFSSFNSVPSSFPPDCPKWRILPYTRRQFQLPATLPSAAQGFTPTPNSTCDDTLSTEPDSSVDDEHTNNNDISGTSLDADSTTFFDHSTSFFNTTTTTLSASQLPPLPALTSITDLEDLPHPSAVTSNPSSSPILTLLVAVISLSEPRTLQTRYGTTTTLYTLTVGDPTLSGFPISIWIRPHPKTLQEREMKAIVMRLRVMDVVVLRGVGLRVFDGRVVGRLLGREGGVEMVWRGGESGGAEERERGERGRNERVRRSWEAGEGGLVGRKVAGVVKWAEMFVGGGGGRARDREEEGSGEDSTVWPQETQAGK